MRHLDLKSLVLVGFGLTAGYCVHAYLDRPSSEYVLQSMGPHRLASKKAARGTVYLLDLHSDNKVDRKFLRVCKGHKCEDYGQPLTAQDQQDYYGLLEKLR